MENFHKQGEGGVEMYRVAKGINLKIREESKDQPEKANNKRYSKLVSEIHIEILICLFASPFAFKLQDDVKFSKTKVIGLLQVEIHLEIHLEIL